MSTGAAIVTGEPGATAPAQPGAAAPAAPDALAWAGENAELRALAQGKGWKAPADALSGYKHLETLLGQRAGNPERLVVLPGDESPQAERDAYWAKAGRPEKPDGYDLKDVPEGDLRDRFGAWAHEAGLSQRQAKAVAGKFMEFSTAAEQEKAATFERDANVVIEQKKKEWGQAYPENILAGRQLAARFRLTEEDLDTWEMAWGTDKFLTKMAEMGRTFGEHKPASGSDSGPLGMTPAIAQQQIKDLEADPDFRAKWLAGNPEAAKKRSDLYKLAYPS